MDHFMVDEGGAPVEDEQVFRAEVAMNERNAAFETLLFQRREAPGEFRMARGSRPVIRVHSQVFEGLKVAELLTPTGPSGTFANPRGV